MNNWHLSSKSFHVYFSIDKLEKSSTIILIICANKLLQFVAPTCRIIFSPLDREIITSSNFSIKELSWSQNLVLQTIFFLLWIDINDLHKWGSQSGADKAKKITSN